MPNQATVEKIIDRITKNICNTLQKHADMFCDAFSVSALFCDIITENDDVDFLTHCGYPLFDEANPFGEFYYVRILKRIRDDLHLGYEADFIGGRIFSDISQGKDSYTKKFFARLLQDALQHHNCSINILRWDGCPVCGEKIYFYEEKCVCGVALDSYEEIESELASIEETLQHVDKVGRNKLTRIKNKLNGYKFSSKGEFWKRKQRIDNLIAQREKELAAIEAEEKAELDRLNNKAKAERMLEDINKDRRRRRFLRIFFSIFFSVLAVVAGGLLYAYFGYWKPMNRLEYTFTEVGEANYEVTGLTSEQVVDLDLSEAFPRLFFQDKKELKSIAPYAFQNNGHMKFVRLPSTLTEIGELAFASCTSLEAVYLASTKPPEIELTTFEDTTCQFYVPQEQYKAYLADEYWGLFSDRIFPDYGNDYEHGTVILDANGGEFINVIESYTLNTVFQMEELPTREGHVFSGWFVNLEDENSQYILGESIVTQSVKLVAKWELQTFTIIYDYDGGTGMWDYSSAMYTQTIGALPSPVKMGYTLDGWFYDEETRVTKDTVFSFAMDITLKAKWIANTYEVTFDCQGGTGISQQKMVAFDSSYGTLPISQKNGYVFSGWYCDGALIEEKTLVQTAADHQLVAKWEPISYSVFFNADDGEMQVDRLDCLFDKEYAVPNPTKNGYTFLYWQNNNGDTFYSGEKFSNLTLEKGQNITFNAIYEKIVYLISYDLDGGINNSLNPTNYTVESNEIVLSAPTKVGYTFVAWYADAEKTNAITSIAQGSTGDVSVYAQWQANMNVLHFNPNGGEGEMEDVEIATDVKYYLPANQFTKRGYFFVGWKNSPDEDMGASYADEATYLMGTGAEYTLYAVWEKRVYEIDYLVDDGVNIATNPTSYMIDSPTIELQPATREGYTFVAWCMDSSLTQEIAVIESGRVGHITLYAKWTANVNTLLFDANGGSGSMPSQQIETGMTARLNKNLFSKSGSKFAGWSYTPNGTSVYSEEAAYTMGVQSQYVLYAIWTQTAYTVQYNLNGGTNSTANPTGYNSEGVSIRLSTPSKTGNTFDGWYKESAFVNKIDEISTGSEGDLVLHAKWKPNQYTVTFNYNGGTGNVSSQMETYSLSYSTLPTAKKTGHKFEGWYYNNNLITESTEVIIAGDHELKAKWTIESYYVYISENNVNVTVIRQDTSKEVASGEKVPFGTSLNISCTTNSGYHDGWCSPSGDHIMPAGDLSIDSGATKDSSCVAKGTLIKTPGFIDVPIERLQVGDLILAWDHRNKTWVETPISLLVYHGDGWNDIIVLEFANGEEVKVIGNHVFYNASKGGYITIDKNNFKDYLDDTFVSLNKSNGLLDTTKLVGAYLTREYTGSYTIVSAYHYNSITNNVVSATPNIPGIYGWISSYLDADLNFDEERFYADVNSYALYDYDKFAVCLSYQQYLELCASYYAVIVGQGYTTFEEVYFIMLMFSYVYG